jgi:glycosyltransferase involved in cell wall biosynthesis
MVLHGAGWFMPEFQHFWSRSDLMQCEPNHAHLFESSFRCAICFSTYQRCLQQEIPSHHRERSELYTLHLPGTSNSIVDQQVLERVREKNTPCLSALSSPYPVMTVGTGKILWVYLKAFQIHHGRTDHKLVVAGKDCHKFKDDYSIPDTDYGRDILFTGWVDQADLPAFYSLADLFLYPSNVEAFPIPITEALACETPIVTSDANGLKELVGEAAMLVNPQ